MKTKLIELWKENCGDCEAAKPIVAELEEEGFVFEKHNIEDQIGRRLWNEEFLHFKIDPRLKKN